MGQPQTREAIYYLQSIAQNLAELSSIANDLPHPSMIGIEALADNRNWLDCYIETLRKTEAAQ